MGEGLGLFGQAGSPEPALEQNSAGHFVQRSVKLVEKSPSLQKPLRVQRGLLPQGLALHGLLLFEQFPQWLLEYG